MLTLHMLVRKLHVGLQTNPQSWQMQVFRIQHELNIFTPSLRDPELCLHLMSYDVVLCDGQARQDLTHGNLMLCICC